MPLHKTIPVIMIPYVRKFLYGCDCKFDAHRIEIENK